MSSFAYADGNFDGQIDNSGRHVVVEAEQKDSAPGFVGATGSSELPEQAQEGSAKPVLRCYGSGAAEGVVFEGDLKVKVHLCRLNRLWLHVSKLRNYS